MGVLSRSPEGVGLLPCVVAISPLLGYMARSLGIGLAFLSWLCSFLDMYIMVIMFSALARRSVLVQGFGALLLDLAPHFSQCMHAKTASALAGSSARAAGAGAGAWCRLGSVL